MKGNRESASNERMLRVDLHSHTDRSPDAAIPPREIAERAAALGIDRIAVTDHGTVEGALEAREVAPERVIVGEEIRCACRTELIGLFLTEGIPQGLPFEEVVERIRDQGGVVYAPHPYAYAWRPLWRAGRALAAADVVEVFNARAFFPPWNRAAARAAESRGLAVAAGSDAHFPYELGRAYTHMPAFTGAESFLEAVQQASAIEVEMTWVGAHMRSAGLKLARQVTELRPVGPLLPRPRTAER